MSSHISSGIDTDKLAEVIIDVQLKVKHIDLIMTLIEDEERRQPADNKEYTSYLHTLISVLESERDEELYGKNKYKTVVEE